MRVEDPILSTAATWRSAFRRSGAIVLRARHAPLNSSTSERSARNSWVTRIVSVLIIPANMPGYTGLSAAKVAGLDPVSDVNFVRKWKNGAAGCALATRQVEQFPDETPSSAANSRHCRPSQSLTRMKSMHPRNHPARMRRSALVCDQSFLDGVVAGF